MSLLPLLSKHLPKYVCNSNRCGDHVEHRPISKRRRSKTKWKTYVDERLCFQILQKSDDSTLKLVNIDESQKKGVAPAIFLKMVQSPIFTTVVMIVVLANTIFTATIRHTHNEEIDRRNFHLYHKIEVKNARFFFSFRDKQNERFFRLYLRCFSILKLCSKSFRWDFKIIFVDRFSNSNLCSPLERQFIAFRSFIEVHWRIFKFFELLDCWNRVRCSKIFSTK